MQTNRVEQDKDKGGLFTAIFCIVIFVAIVISENVEATDHDTTRPLDPVEQAGLYYLATFGIAVTSLYVYRQDGLATIPTVAAITAFTIYIARADTVPGLEFAKLVLVVTGSAFAFIGAADIATRRRRA